jgi:hypothetical protein
MFYSAGESSFSIPGIGKSPSTVSTRTNIGGLAIFASRVFQAVMNEAPCGRAVHEEPAFATCGVRTMAIVATFLYYIGKGRLCRAQKETICQDCKNGQAGLCYGSKKSFGIIVPSTRSMPYLADGFVNPYSTSNMILNRSGGILCVVVTPRVWYCSKRRRLSRWDDSSCRAAIICGAFSKRFRNEALGQFLFAQASVLRILAYDFVD